MSEEKRECILFKIRRLTRPAHAAPASSALTVLVFRGCEGAELQSSELAI